MDRLDFLKRRFNTERVTSTEVTLKVAVEMAKKAVMQHTYLFFILPQTGRVLSPVAERFIFPVRRRSGAQAAGRRSARRRP